MSFSQNFIGIDVKYSRQEYLKKREEKKLELRDDKEDEQYLFEGVKLSEVEQRELRHKKELYELIKKRSEEADNMNEYRMPDAYDQEGGVDQEKRFSVATQRYRDANAEEKMNPFAEQEAWEEHQIGKAMLKYGSKNRKQDSDDYQFVFEDQIDFIKASVMDGDKFDYDEMADSIEKSKAKSSSEALQMPHSKGEQRVATSQRLFNLCSLLMSTLFAYSASVQLNDPDWYFWFPLYSCACLINLTNYIITTKLNKPIATITLWIGILLCSKVVVEDYLYEIAGFWSLDLSERVVREKIGSIFVVISTILQMEAASDVQTDISNIVKYGMLILVVFSYLLPFVFFVVLKGEMKL